MRFSIIISVAVMLGMGVYLIQNYFGDNSVIVYFMLGLFVVYNFFKYVVNA